MATKPFFRGGRLVRKDSITKFKAQQMQQASSWTPVSSSNIGHICWKSEEEDQVKHGLGVWFKSKDGSGSVYFYTSAPFEVYKEMMKASSKGAFLHEQVKPNYPHVGPFGS